MKKEYVDIIGEVVKVYTIQEIETSKIWTFLYDGVYDSLLTLDDTVENWEGAKETSLQDFKNSICDPNYSQKFFKLYDGTVVRWNKKELTPIFEDAKIAALKDYKENHNPENLEL